MHFFKAFLKSLQLEFEFEAEKKKCKGGWDSTNNSIARYFKNMFLRGSCNCSNILVIVLYFMEHCLWCRPAELLIVLQIVCGY